MPTQPGVPEGESDGPSAFLDFVRFEVLPLLEANCAGSLVEGAIRLRALTELSRGATTPDLVKLVGSEPR